ncbi:MAG: hypothetical protein K0Q49_31 [Haloplasmataceae bacterium]|jgi:hypothetical protein|nr:hypothetical protein [Haloplasmataceae bacterium]
MEKLKITKTLRDIKGEKIYTSSYYLIKDLCIWALKM